MIFEDKAEIVINQLRADRDRLQNLVDNHVAELKKIRAEIEDTGAYEQEVNGKTEFLKGITYCLSIIDKYKAESETESGKELENPFNDCRFGG